MSMDGPTFFLTKLLNHSSVCMDDRQIDCRHTQANDSPHLILTKKGISSLGLKLNVF